MKYKEPEVILLSSKLSNIILDSILYVCIGGLLVIGLIFFIGYYDLVFSIYSTIDYYQEDEIVEGFKFASEVWKADKTVKSIAHLCSINRTYEDQVDCVHIMIYYLVEYVDHDIGNKLRDTPYETIEQGGVCRDKAVLGCAVFENLNFTCDFVMQPGHVYINVTRQDFEKICEVELMDFEGIACYDKNQTKNVLLGQGEKTAVVTRVEE